MNNIVALHIVVVNIVFVHKNESPQFLNKSWGRKQEVTSFEQLSGEGNGALIPPEEELRVLVLFAQTRHAGKQNFYTFLWNWLLKSQHSGYQQFVLMQKTFSPTDAIPCVTVN